MLRAKPHTGAKQFHKEFLHFYISMGLASYLRSTESKKITLKQLIGATEKERDKKKIIVRIP